MTTKAPPALPPLQGPGLPFRAVLLSDGLLRVSVGHSEGSVQVLHAVADVGDSIPRVVL